MAYRGCFGAVELVTSDPSSIRTITMFRIVPRGLFKPLAKAQSVQNCSYRAGSLPFGANHHLRQSFVFLNIPAMPQPEAYLGHADKLFDANGKLSNDGTRKFLEGFIQAYAAWITANSQS
jgi:hypothetical protein